MGLDQYAYKVEKGLIPEGVEVDFDIISEEDYVREDWYWRKNNYLQSWMESFYYKKNGKSDSFNCVNVKLTKEDLLSLKSDIENKTLTETAGFFFGGGYEYYNNEYGAAIKDLKFIEEALQAIEDGMDVYYSSWW